MLKIGDFSKLSRVSVRMLRHYDEIGLLKPAETNRFTDYRYYREDQLPAVCRITALKDMGFSLADIVRILDVYDDKEKLERYFVDRERKLKQLSLDTIHLPEAEYLMFQGPISREEDYCEAIRTV